MKPILGITMGDAAGIGPELILKSLCNHNFGSSCRPLIIGSKAVMEFYRDKLGLDICFRTISSVSEAQFVRGVIDILDRNALSADDIKVGELSPKLGKAAVLYTEEAGRLALAGEIDAIVSAPLNKESMRMAGYKYEGQTQILAELCKAKRHGMILLLGNIRVMMLTTHMSLQDACKAVTKDRVLAMIELAHESLMTFGILNPIIAVAGLNPHSGERGLFGTEEVNGSSPAIAEAKSKGIDVVGPVPADVVFVKAKEGHYDLVLAMYHDQANMAAKLLGFGEVVTVLAGLPIIRTSVGHGTAFDIAGQGVADEGNFVRSIKSAIEFANLKNKVKV